MISYDDLLVISSSEVFFLVFLSTTPGDSEIWKHMQSCSGYPHPNVVQHFEVLELPNKKGLEVRGIGQGCVWL